MRTERVRTRLGLIGTFAVVAVATAGACLDFDLALSECDDGGRCSMPIDAGGGVDASADGSQTSDASQSDASAVDGGPVLDAGTLDAGIADSGPESADAGNHDAGLADGGWVDSGVDSGLADANYRDAGADAGAADAGRTDAGSTGPGITLIQVQPAQYANAPSLSVPITVTAGNFLVVATAYQQVVTVTVTDTLDNVFTPLPAVVNTNCGTVNGSVSAAQIWYVNGALGGPDMVTMTPSASPIYLWLVVAEYAGIATSTPVESTNGTVATGSTPTLSIGNLSASAPNNLLFGVFHDEAGSSTTTLTPSALLGGIAFAPGFIALAGDNTAVAPGTYDPTATDSQSDNCWVATGAVFAGK
jgi:hypothetical protein